MSNCATFRATFTESLNFNASFGERIPMYPESYTGGYVVTPSEEEITLETAGLMMISNVTVGAIPNNYGRILYNGSTITVY